MVVVFRVVSVLLLSIPDLTLTMTFLFVVQVVGNGSHATKVLFCIVGHLFKPVRCGATGRGGFVGVGGGVVGELVGLAVSKKRPQQSM